MTKTHFEAIAALLRTASQEAVSEGSDEAVDILGNLGFDLADYFATVNPRFDRDRFLEAALGIEPSFSV